MLSQPIRQEFLLQLDIEIQHFGAAWFESRLHHLEARYTLFCLKQCLSTYSRNHEKEIMEIFAARWKRIQDSDAQYLHDFTNPANRACIAMATRLGGLLRRPYLTLLMPSLLVVNPSAYITYSYTDPLNLHELILSDCNQRLISLPDVLDFAQEDALLKHNSLFDEEQKLLSVTERERLLSRHPIIRTTYEALNARMIYKYHGDTVGAALKRLIEGLRAGGRWSRGPAHEYDSGREANEAVFDFHQYLTTLDDEVRTKLMSASKFDRYDNDQQPTWLTIEILWGRLARLNGTDFTQTIFCVEIIANQLEEILNENPGLYDLLSYQGSATQNMSALNEAVHNARVAVNRALASLQKHPSYGLSGDKKLCSKLLTQIEREHHREFSFHTDDIVYLIRQYIIDLNQRKHGVKKAVVARTLTEIVDMYQSRLINEVIKNLSDEEQQPFLKLTGFNPQPYRFRHSPGLTFLPSRETRKGKTDPLEDGVAAAAITAPSSRI